MIPTHKDKICTTQETTQHNIYKIQLQLKVTTEENGEEQTEMQLGLTTVNCEEEYCSREKAC